MSRYVEKEAFIALLNKRIYCLCGGETVKETRNIRDMLEVFPAADVKPVKRGNWVDKERHEHYPSGKPYTARYCGVCGKRDHNEDGDFCGYCGADMRKEEDDER